MGIALVLSLSSTWAAGFDSTYFPGDMYFGPSRIQLGFRKTTGNIHGTIQSPSGRRAESNDIYRHKLSPILGIRYVKDQLGITLLYQRPFQVNTYYQRIPGMDFLPSESSLTSDMVSAMASYTQPSRLIGGNVTLTGGINQLKGQGRLGTYIPNAELIAILPFKTSYFPSIGMNYSNDTYGITANFMYHGESKTTAKNATLDNDSIEVRELVVSPSRYHFHLQSGIHPQWGIGAGYIHVQWAKTPTINIIAESGNRITPLFSRDGNYYYGMLAHQYNKKINLHAVIFHEAAGKERASLRTASSGGITSYTAGSTLTLNSQLKVSGNYSLIRIQASQASQAVGPSGSEITGDYPATTGHNFAIKMEYFLS